MVDIPAKPAEASPVADEITNANVISVHFDSTLGAGGLWVAQIGPADTGLSAEGMTPISAINALSLQAHYGHWSFDKTWKPSK